MATAIAGKRSGNAIVPTSQLPVITEWADRTAEANASWLPANTDVATSSYTHYFTRRVGDNLEINFKWTGVDAGSSIGQVSWVIPDSLTAKNTYMPVGLFTTYNVSMTEPATSAYATALAYVVASTNAFHMSLMGGGAPIDGSKIGASSEIYAAISIPIATWAGTGVTGSTDASLYVDPATPTVAGLMSTEAQAFAGVKTFNDGIGFGDNTLSVFKTGPWTPDWQGNWIGSQAIWNWSVSANNWIRIGSSVWVSAHMTLDSVTNSGSRAGNMFTPTGLPYTCNGVYNGSVRPHLVDLSPGTSMSMRTISGTSTWDFWITASGGGSQTFGSYYPSIGCTIDISMRYETNDAP